VVLFSFSPLRGYAQSQKKSEEPSSSGSITGSVRTDSEAVVNATVTALRMDSGSEIRTVPTNDIGRFTIKGLRPGLYRLSVTAPTYVSRDQELESETTYQIGDSVSLMMVDGGMITGKVVDSQGDPIVGIRIGAMMIRDRAGK